MSTTQAGFMHRSIEHYPTNSRRIWYLALAVAATIILYYESYVLPSVAPLVLKQFGLTLAEYVYIIVVSNLLGACASIFGSLSDRIGRANLVVYGILISSLLTFGISLSGSTPLFLVFSWLLGIVEGIILVATPALVRDFSPRLGRATAMGFWTVGPVGGSVLATVVSSQTLPIYTTWQSQYVIAAIAGLVICIICFFGLRELSPALRNQIMLTLREKELIEARARGIDVDTTLRNPWRQMLRPRIVSSALGISLFLLIYFAAVAYLPLYFTSIFGYSLATANGLVSVFWIVNIVSAIVVGLISDWTLVRKPFMIIGSIATMIVTIIFISRIGQPTSSTFMAVLLGLFGITISTAYVAWMAGYTETVETVNPALVATGIAVWGFIIRMIVVISSLAFPIVVHTSTNGQQWATWWWVCIGGMVLFIPTVFYTVGFWRTSQARADTLAKERAEGLIAESI